MTSCTLELSHIVRRGVSSPTRLSEIIECVRNEDETIQFGMNPDDKCRVIGIDGPLKTSLHTDADLQNFFRFLQHTKLPSFEVRLLDPSQAAFQNLNQVENGFRSHSHALSRLQSYNRILRVMRFKNSESVKVLVDVGCLPDSASTEKRRYLEGADFCDICLTYLHDCPSDTELQQYDRLLNRETLINYLFTGLYHFLETEKRASQFLRKAGIRVLSEVREVSQTNWRNLIRVFTSLVKFPGAYEEITKYRFATRIFHTCTRFIHQILLVVYSLDFLATYLELFTALHENQISRETGQKYIKLCSQAARQYPADSTVIYQVLLINRILTPCMDILTQFQVNEIYHITQTCTSIPSIVREYLRVFFVFTSFQNFRQNGTEHVNLIIQCLKKYPDDIHIRHEVVLCLARLATLNAAKIRQLDGCELMRDILKSQINEENKAIEISIIANALNVLTYLSGDVIAFETCEYLRVVELTLDKLQEYPENEEIQEVGFRLLAAFSGCSAFQSPETTRKALDLLLHALKIHSSESVATNACYAIGVFAATSTFVCHYILNADGAKLLRKVMLSGYPLAVEQAASAFSIVLYSLPEFDPSNVVSCHELEQILRLPEIESEKSSLKQIIKFIAILLSSGNDIIPQFSPLFQITTEILERHLKLNSPEVNSILIYGFRVLYMLYESGISLAIQNFVCDKVLYTKEKRRNWLYEVCLDLLAILTNDRYECVDDQVISQLNTDFVQECLNPSEYSPFYLTKILRIIVRVSSEETLVERRKMCTALLGYIESLDQVDENFFRQICTFIINLAQDRLSRKEILGNYGDKLLIRFLKRIEVPEIRHRVIATIAQLYSTESIYEPDVLIYVIEELCLTEDAQVLESICRFIANVTTTNYGCYCFKQVEEDMKISLFQKLETCINEASYEMLDPLLCGITGAYLISINRDELDKLLDLLKDALQRGLGQNFALSLSRVFVRLRKHPDEAEYFRKKLEEKEVSISSLEEDRLSPNVRVCLKVLQRFMQDTRI